MANNFTVVVILPNARRVNMKINPNTIILQILEDVCKKQELNPIDWDLTHHNKVVELANSIRFSGIPNNGTLEMVQSTKIRKESSVNLGLQLESGKRLQHPFLPQQTLWEVLEYWASQGEDVYPEKDNAMEKQAVCIYMRQEILGEEQLKNKTLRALGLTQGNAMIRLIHRSESQLKHQANVSAPLSRAAIVVDNVPTASNNLPHAPNNLPPASKPIEKAGVVRECLEKSSASDPEPMDLSPLPETDIKSNVVSDVSVIKKNQENKMDDQRTMKAKQSIGDQHEQPLAPIAPAITNAQRYSTEGQFHLLGSRDAILFHSDDVAVSTSQELLQDDFFEITISDVRKMYRELREKRTVMEEAPLQTKSARDLEKDVTMLRQLHDYPNTVVRVRFGNRYVLQGTFRTADTICKIETWLREYLNVQDLHFYLFSTPPKKILQKETRLVEEGLVGMAVIYFGSDDPSVQTDQAVLKPEVYSKVSDPISAFEFIRKKLRKEKRDMISNDCEGGNSLAESDIEASQNPAGTSSSSTANNSSEESRSANAVQRKPVQQPRNVAGTSDAGNVPKWFKLAK